MSWHCKTSGAYARTSTEAQENARMIYGILSANGWTVEAISGLLGNIESESGYNPWRWQGDKIGVSTGAPWTNKGYGLTQFTPANKYIGNASSFTGYGPNFSDKTGNNSDGYAQMLYLNDHADYIKTSAYPLSYEEFKQSSEDAGYLAIVWLYNYERPADPSSTKAARKAAGEYWYSVLSGEEPPTPTPISGDTTILKYIIFMQEVTKHVR